MSNQAFYIPSGGVGETEYDKEENKWYNERYFDLTREISKQGNGIAKSCVLIEDYTEALFCTGEIHTIRYCLDVYRQYLNNEPFDYPIFLSSEIKETLPKLHTELVIFKKKITKFCKQIKKLTPKKFNSYKLQRVFIKDL